MDAGSILTSAREMDPSFTQERHTNRVALHRLSRLQRQLVEQHVKLEPDAYAETFEIELPLADFDAGVELAVEAESESVPLEVLAYHPPLDLWMQGEEDRPRGLELVSYASRHRSGPCAWIRDGRLYLSGTSDDWTDAERIVLTFTAQPSEVTTTGAELVLPGSAEEVLVARMAEFFAKRSRKEELARDRREFQADANDAEALWLDGLRRRRPVTSARAREVW